jgi:surfeit locus 1 family protein
VYRFALRPRWILSHLLVAAIVLGCLWAGFWQLRRLDERRDAIDRYEARTAMEVAPVEDLLEVDSSDAAVAEVALRPATATGTYLADGEVTVRNRSLDGAPGHWVVTPLLLPDGTAVLVNRGWVPLAVVDDLTTVAPPDGEVVVRGTLSEPQERGRLGAVDEGGEDVVDFARVDVDLIAERLDVPALPAYLTLDAQDPPQAELPVPVDVVDPEEGPHLGYAVQWFIFAAIAAGGYPLILRRVAGDRAAEEADGDTSTRRRRRPSPVPVDD